MASSIQQQTEEIGRKNAENERLLLNILPGPIADPQEVRAQVVPAVAHLLGLGLFPGE